MTDYSVIWSIVGALSIGASFAAATPVGALMRKAGRRLGRWLAHGPVTWVAGFCLSEETVISMITIIAIRFHGDPEVMCRALSQSKCGGAIDWHLRRLARRRVRQGRCMAPTWSTHP